MNQQKISTKNNSRLATYVHDAMELETKLYTMRELEKSLENSEKAFEVEMRKKLPKAPIYEAMQPYATPMAEIGEEDQQQRIKIINDKTNKEIHKKGIKGYLSEHLDVALGLCTVLTIPLFLVLLWFFYDRFVFMLQDDFNAMFAIIGITVGIDILLFVVILIIILISGLYKAKRKFAAEEAAELNAIQIENNKAKIHNTYLSETNAKIKADNLARQERNEQRKANYEFLYQRAKAKYDNQCAAYHAQLNQVKQSIQELEAQRTRFYAIGIIPPDYREIDQIYQFDQIFRNDLADNMREAVKIYEERVFRGEVIRGINNIVASINNLTGVMSGLARTIESVQTQVSFLSQDVYQMAQSQAAQQAESQAQLESIMSNAKATRFAAEAVRENSEKLVRYEEDRRRGYL